MAVLSASLPACHRLGKQQLLIDFPTATKRTRPRKRPPLTWFSAAATMSAKSIYEADGKAILNYHLTRAPVIKPSPLPPPSKHNPPPRLASLHFAEDVAVEDVLNQAEVTYPWLLQPGAKFVAKPDQLIKRRGKSGLLALNKTWADARAWIAERAGTAQKVETTHGVLRHFLVEPFVPHKQAEEYYININSVRDVSVSCLSPRVASLSLSVSSGRCEQDGRQVQSVAASC